MATANLRFYFDENVPLEAAIQLRQKEIDVETASELGFLDVEDEEHLAYAARSGRVLCTYDADFDVLATKNMDHYGIVKGVARKHHIRHWVVGLEFLHSLLGADDMLNTYEHLSNLV